MEDICRDAGSFDAEEDDLHSECLPTTLLFPEICVAASLNVFIPLKELQTELEKLSENDEEVYQPLSAAVAVCIIILSAWLFLSKRLLKKCS